jgi:sugar/nucleoside kinase (ribokinase family)
MHQNFPAIEYLAVGHIARDITSQGMKLGGTVAYAGRTAKALGLSVGIVTSFNDRPEDNHPEDNRPEDNRPEDGLLTLDPLTGINVFNIHSKSPTTFENTYSPGSRIQHLHARAHTLDRGAIPDEWRNAMIVHLAPIAAEVDPALMNAFPNSFVGLTAQGWLRSWDRAGLVRHRDWTEIKNELPQADAVVLSLEDLQNSEDTAAEMADECAILAVTMASRGVRIYFQGTVRDIPAPQTNVVESTGAGDIFAAAFFTRYYDTQDPWEAGRFANNLASNSVSRNGLSSTPTAGEIYSAVTKAPL